MNETDALRIVRQLLAGVLPGGPGEHVHRVRDLSTRIGELEATIRAALTVIDQTGDAK